MIDYRAVEAKAHEWTQHHTKPPRYDPWMAALTSGFGAGIVAFVPLAIVGAGEQETQMASFWTALIVGALVYLWFWTEKRKYDKAFNVLYSAFLAEEKSRQSGD